MRQRALLAAALLLAAAASGVALAQGGGAGRSSGSDVWRRLRDERDFFQQKHPCPVNGKKVGNCPGHRIGLVVPPRRGGTIRQENMRWMTDEEYDATQENLPE
jgi:hypothetical protein